jgi:hypothetical protein
VRSVRWLGILVMGMDGSQTGRWAEDCVRLFKLDRRGRLMFLLLQTLVVA